MIKPKVITVIGANGTMGCLASGIMAAFGEAKVYMVCRDINKATKAAVKAAASVKADAVKINLIPKTYEELEGCIKESDWVFESAAESYEIKQEINQLISKYADKDTIISTGTSGLSINKLSKSLNKDLQKRYIGTHFFNPPYSLNLCEVIPTENTDKEFLEEFKIYLRDILLRSIVEIKDEPGFLANRIGFQFMNEVLQEAEKHANQGGIDYIDAILGGFTGRSMAPLVTLDFVGLDIHKSIVENILENTQDYANDSFKLPTFINKLISENKLGRKVGEGLYKGVVNQETGKKEIWVYDLTTEDYRKKRKYEFEFAKKMINALAEGNYSEAFKVLLEDASYEAHIALTFLLKYTIYSITLAREIAADICDADIVMAEGFNWVPPLGIVQALGGPDTMKKICLEKLEKTFLDKIDLDKLFDFDQKSKYDYRRYFKAK